MHALSWISPSAFVLSFGLEPSGWCCTPSEQGPLPSPILRDTPAVYLPGRSKSSQGDSKDEGSQMVLRLGTQSGIN